MNFKTFSMQLAGFDNSWYHPGAGKTKRIIWYIINHIIFDSFLFPYFNLKTNLLRMFGAKIGKGFVIKPSVNIKYPWHLKVGDYSWIGENVWIDNLDDIEIGSNVCISQEVMLFCGNHNFRKETFDLFIGKIIIEDGVWLGARSIVCPGVICRTHSVLTVGSVATGDLEAFAIYQGNPAIKIKDRISEKA